MDLLPEINKLLAGFWFVFGGLFAIMLSSMIRGAGVAGGRALVYLSTIAHAWFRYRQGADPTINVTLHTTRGGVLTLDTWIDERQLKDVWHNAYHVMRLNKMATLCSETDPLVKFRRRVKGGWEPVSTGGPPKTDEYRRTYDRLVTLIAADITNQNSLDFSLGRDVVEHRFVVALTYEKNSIVRSQHFRVMVIREDELLRLPDEVRVHRPEQESRVETLRQIARQYKEDWIVDEDHPARFGVLRVFRPATVDPIMGLEPSPLDDARSTDAKASELRGLDRRGRSGY